MIDILWGNPVAWLGLGTIALPIIVHLLARRRASSVPFPTLRFLPGSSSTSIRRHRFEDLPLLALRCAILAAAAAALAQPWVVRPGGSNPAGEPARAIIVDTSASMNRPTPGGPTARAAADTAAERLAASAPVATIIEAADLRAGIARARIWLESLDGETAPALTLISDFQAGALAGSDLAALPEGAGIELERIAVVAQPLIELPRLRVGAETWTTTATVDEESTLARWDAMPEAGGETPDVAWLAGPDEQTGALAAMEAARRVTPVAASAGETPITVVWPGAAERADLAAASAPVDEPWMADVLAALPPDAKTTGGSRDSRLLLFPDVEPGSLASATLMASLLRATASAPVPTAELEPEVLEDETLRGWERAAGPVATAGGNDGRWVWLLVIGLLFTEQWVRRTRAGRSDVS